MADRLRAKTRGFRYPVGADLERVLEAGGFSKLPPDEQRVLWDRMRVVQIGEFCDDMDGVSAELYLRRGDIEWVEVDPPEPSRHESEG